MQYQSNALDGDMSLAVVSEVDKQRVAREVICFLYRLNPQHVISKVCRVSVGNVDDQKKQLIRNVKEWCKNLT